MVGGDHVGAPGVGEVPSGALRHKSFWMEVLRITNRRLTQKSFVGWDVEVLVLKCTQVDRVAQLNLVISMRRKREDMLVLNRVFLAVHNSSIGLIVCRSVRRAPLTIREFHNTTE